MHYSISYWVAAFLCWDLIECLYFVDTAERGDRGWEEAQRQGENRVTLWITLISRRTDLRDLQRVASCKPISLFCASIHNSYKLLIILISLSKDNPLEENEVTRPCCNHTSFSSNHAGVESTHWLMRHMGPLWFWVYRLHTSCGWVYQF